ncbi:MAG: PSD1 and planctomycete cytochrome C domain-containing protein [Pirellulaceae bacterium]|nr:PSD1 and planctomycete cytochrome C domain-containing protein [Pirellulaceae bacterium]
MMLRLAGCLSALLLALVPLNLPAAEPDAAALEFFEKSVRPILVARCYECHSGTAKKVQGSLRVDSLAALTKGGDTGPAVVPGKLKESLLIDAINYGGLYQMPPKSKMPADEIATLTKWVEMGAPWPKETIAASAAGSGADFDLAARKAAHWCWQPITSPPVPEIRDPQSAIRNPIDAFILAKLHDKGLAPAPPADARTLVRRLYFDLIGLPPTPAEVEEFEQSASRDPQSAMAALVDRLLDSPHFGERWGRHWLDLVRYAESRGHEFDYNTPNAFEYRDYVIRALNADVPYDQFLTEHVAGDLLDKPRLHPQEGFNESIIGTGFWFLGEWVHSPVDIRKDECDRMDNMLDVFSKTFLGLTVTCARCHDHKFDAISQKDYYALAGYLQSSSYRLARYETWEQDRQIAGELAALDDKFAPQIAAAAVKLLQPQIDELSGKLANQADKLTAELGVLEFSPGTAEVIIDYANPPANSWFANGPTFGPGPVRAGELLLPTDPAAPLQLATYGAAQRDLAWPDLGVAAPSENDAGRLSGWVRAGRTLKTPTWTLKTGQVHYLIEGAGQVYAAVDSHAMINGPLHGELAKETGGTRDLPARWITHDLSRYVGQRVHLEFSPKADEDFRILMVVEGPVRPVPPVMRPNALLEKLASEAAARELITTTLDLVARDKVSADPQPRDRALLANWIIAAAGPADPDDDLSRRIAAYQTERAKLTGAIRRDSRLCLAMWEGNGVDENLLIRGNHKTIGPVVPRRMLEAVGERGAGFQPARAGSGRLELARELVDRRNPFVSRVLANRVWHHLFGRGIVPSVDNFGVLGQLPTHPELLDHLAHQFMQDGWSVKRLIRSIVLSSTYQQASSHKPDAPARDVRAESADPQNLLFHRQNLKRLEGEAIRDAILAISGRLDRRPLGPSVPVHLTPFMQGRGRPGSGPVDGAGRRSIYISIRRNFLSPMMLAYDTPIPFSTVGRRNVSNVPAQALILMNDPFVSEQARVWARRVLSDGKLTTPESRIRRMYLQAYGREPAGTEISAARAFLDQQSREYELPAGTNPLDERVWADLAHVLLNVKEFVFVD